jgi:uncharacterized protein (TIGR00156 family)
MKTFLLILTAALGVASGAAHAQYTGPSAAAKTAPGAAPAAAASNVKALLANAKDDTVVSLQGRIVRHLGGEKYRFADSTGEIDLDIDADKWPANTPIDDKVQVKLQGEYDKKLIGNSEIDVERIEKIQ